MAGIYVHIPFCKQACYYCDFHFSTFHALIEPVVECIQNELKLQKNYLNREEIRSVYLGGGTPSLLKVNQLASLMENIHELFPISHNAEITMEANPDDLNKKKLKNIKDLGINRISLGIQSFDNEILQYLNRAHTAEKGITAFREARDQGFNNINIDLIYAVRKNYLDRLKSDLEIIVELDPDHISAYGLTIEIKTVFGNWLKNGKIAPVEEDRVADEFECIESQLSHSAYEHYETSNYAKPGCISIHNLNYWTCGSYLGVGPSAHSYNQYSRQFNIDNNANYIKAIQQGWIPATMDYLSVKDRINERIFMGLRTKWGCHMAGLKKEFQFDLYTTRKEYLKDLIQKELAIIKNESLILTGAGKLLADKISADLLLNDQ